MIIHKVIEFSPFPANAIFYNLALLNINEDGTVSDLSVSNNQDMPKVMATVFKALTYFFEKWFTSKEVTIQVYDPAI